MEFLLAGSIIGAGFMLSKDGKERILKDKKLNEPNPSENNIYDSNYYNKTKKKIITKVNNNFQKSRNAIETNIIPPQFNNKIFNTHHNAIKYLQQPENTNNSNSNFISKLSGESMHVEEFSHNNMTPFFGGSVKQNTYEFANQPILELYTGTDKLDTKKKETEPFFKPSKNINNVYGTQINTEKILNRYLPSQKKKNEFPIEKVIVGPGLNNGYTNIPSGGFHQADTREYYMPKSVDEKRVITNPKLTYKGRIISGKAINQKPKVIGKVNKFRPDTYSKHGPEKYFTTVGAFTKEKYKSCIIMPDTNRKKSKSYLGPSEPATKINQKARGNYRKSTKNIFKSSGPRNINMEDNWKNTNIADYGKKNIKLPPNERDITGKRTHITNLTSIVKALVAPIQDIFRTTRKENLISNIRKSGNINITGPKNHTSRDPNDIAKTTIKETNIHNTRTGYLSGKNKLTVYDPNNVARTTIKETNIHDSRTGNLKNNTKLTIYDPNDITRTTIKETNIHDTRTGNIGARERGHTYDPNDVARTTIKETNIHDTRTGNIGARERGQAYDPNDVARTTIKETNIHDTRTGYLQTSTNSKGIVYDKEEIKPKITIRNTTKPEDTILNMKLNNKQTVYDPNDITRTTIKETNIHDTHSGNLSGFNKQYVYDPNNVARTTIKETTIDDTRTGNINNLEGKEGAYLTNIKEAPNTNRQFSTKEYTGIMQGDVNNNGGKGYITNVFEAPNTNRQFSTKEYTGTADSINNKPMSYNDIYNMTLNQVKEDTLKNRKPTQSNISMNIDKNFINMDIKKIEGDYINTRNPNTTKVYNSIGEIKQCSVTTYKDQLDNDKIASRINPEMLNAFKSNPYSQPLDSHVFH